MKISVADFPLEGLELKGSTSTEGFDLPQEGFSEWNTIQYDLRIDKSGSEYLVTGKLDTSMKVACSRCLEWIPWQIHVDSFATSFPVEGQQAIDLTPSMREDILLTLPIAPGCKLDGDERCSITGVIHKPKADDFSELHRKSVWDALENIKTKE